MTDGCSHLEEKRRAVRISDFRHPVGRRAFVFDMFGTLVVNSLGTLDPLFDKLCSYYPGIDPLALMDDYHSFAKEFRDSNPGRELSIDRIIRHLDASFGFDNDPSSMEDPLLRNTRIFTAAPGARELMAYLKNNGYLVGVLSNSRYHSPTLRGILEDEGLAEYADCVLSSADIGFKKPCREAYAAVLDELGADAADSFFAGDKLSCDYDGPLSASFRAAVLIRRCDDPGIFSVCSIGEITDVLRDANSS